MKKDLTLPTLVSVVVLLAFSSVGATYAWYQYNANVIIDYNGTSIGSSTVFEVGLVSETPLEDYEDYGLVREQIGDKDVYWCASEVTTNISKYYLSSNGYATSVLNGVTSGKFVENGDFSLKRNPEYKNNYFYPYDVDEQYRFAEKRNYAHFELVFKVNSITPEGASIVDSSAVSLKAYDLDSDGDLKKSVRIHFESGNSSLIFNPSSKNDGEDIVGGILDLNNDGVYDVETNRYGDFETIYGEYESYEYYEDPISDGVFSSPMGGDGNVFVADHKNGVHILDMEKTKFSTSDFKGRESIIDKKQVLAYSGDDGLAYLNLDVYMEGWDHAFTNAEMNHEFNLGLEFECK